MKLLVKLVGTLFAIIACISLIKFFSNLIGNHLISTLWYLILVIFCVYVVYQAIKTVKEINQKEYEEYQKLLKNRSKPPLPLNISKNSDDSPVTPSIVKENPTNDILSDIPPFLRDSVNLDLKKEAALTKVKTLQAEVFDKAAANLSLEEFVSVDVETTGLDPEDDRTIEISAVKFTNGKVSDEFSSLVNPGKPIPPEATKINKITDDTVKEINQKEYQELLKNQSKPPLPLNINKNSDDSPVTPSIVKENPTNDILSDIPPFLRDSVNLDLKKEAALTKVKTLQAEVFDKAAANLSLEEFVLLTLKQLVLIQKMTELSKYRQ